MLDLKSVGRGRGSRKNHKKGIAAQLKDAKRAEAKVRQAEYDKLTVAQKLAKLDAGGYNATKQRAKLTYSAMLDSIKHRV